MLQDREVSPPDKDRQKEGWAERVQIDRECNSCREDGGGENRGWEEAYGTCCFADQLVRCTWLVLLHGAHCVLQCPLFVVVLF